MTTPPPYELGDVMPAPQRKSRTGLIVGVVVAVAATVGLGIGAVVLVQADNEPPTAAGPVGSTPSPTCAGFSVDASTGAVVCGPAAGAPVVNEGPTYDAPTVTDFKLTLKTLKKECFGSAGCNVQFRIQVAYTGSGALDPAKTYEVSYSVRGGEDPLENTFTVTGDRASVEEEELLSTKASSAKLTVVVTEVSEY